jgi:hypothetical protein
VRTDPALLSDLRAAVGVDGLLVSAEACAPYECDALTTRHKAMPELVVLPTTTDQVAASDFIFDRGINTSGNAFYHGAFVGLQDVR